MDSATRKKPATGYDKVTVANDICALAAKFGLRPRVTVIGHDMGGMVTYANSTSRNGPLRGKIKPMAHEKTR